LGPDGRLSHAPHAAVEQPCPALVAQADHAVVDRWIRTGHPVQAAPGLVELLARPVGPGDELIVAEDPAPQLAAGDLRPAHHLAVARRPANPILEVAALAH